MLTGWIRLVKLTKALPASGLRVFKLMARDIHVGHRIALLEPQGARHHTPLRDMRPFDFPSQQIECQQTSEHGRHLANIQPRDSRGAANI